MPKSFDFTLTLAAIFSVIAIIVIVLIFRFKKEQDLFNQKAKELGFTNSIQMAIGVFIWQGSWRDHIVTMNLIQSWSQYSRTQTGGIEISIYGGNIKNQELMELKSKSLIFILTQHDNFKNLLPKEMSDELKSLPYSIISKANSAILRFLPDTIKFTHPEISDGINIKCIIPKESSSSEIIETLDKMSKIIREI